MRIVSGKPDESPQDMDKLKLSLQGYNYGNGYISWAIRNHGGYSEANALQFSQEQAAAHGGQVMAIQSMYPMCFGIILAGIVCRTFWKWAACDHCEKPVGERRRPEVLVVVGIHRATRMVCLFRVLVCRPGRTHSKRCGAKIFCLYGREELVSKPRKMAGAGSMPSPGAIIFLTGSMMERATMWESWNAVTEQPSIP